jgi:hypothetical protein
MSDRSRALMWALAWWVARRYIRRRASMAVAGFAAGATAQRTRLRGVLAAVALVGVLAAAFVAWRRLAGPSEDEWTSLNGSPPSTDAPVPTATA